MVSLQIIIMEPLDLIKHKTCRHSKSNPVGPKQNPDKNYIITFLCTVLQMPTIGPITTGKNKYLMQHQEQIIVM